MIKKLIITITVGLSVLKMGYSQDIHFSQYYANPLYLNPAFAGTAICPRLIMNYRDQWPAIPGTYSTYSASVDHHIEKISGGLGFMFNTDKAGQGTLTTNIISGIYSYKLQVNRFFSMRAAVQGTWFQKKIDWDKLNFGDMIDSRYGFIVYTQETRPDKLSKGAIDFSAGVLGFGESYYGGVALSHLNEPMEGFFSLTKLPMRLTAHAGCVLDLQQRRKRRKIEDPTVSPNILYMHQRDFEQFNWGFYVNRFPLVGGVWFRHNTGNADALIILLGFRTYTFQFGYSYDVTISRLGTYSAGAHEFSSAFQFNCKTKKKRIRIINCPSF